MSKPTSTVFPTDVYTIGKLLPGLFAVFELSTLRAVYVNTAGLTRLDPAGSADFDRMTIADFIGMNDIDRFHREIHLQLRVRGSWMGPLSLRDMLGSEFRTQVHFLEATDGDRSNHHLYLYAILPKTGDANGDVGISDEDMLHALLDSTPSSIYFKDLASRYLRISRAKALKHGLSDPRDSIGKTDFDYFTIEHAAPAFNDEQSIIKTGVPVLDLEEKETFNDGTIRWVSTTKQPFYNRLGKLVGTFGISRDITQEKLAEESLRESEALFRTVFEGTSNAVVLFSENHFIDANLKALQMFGKTKEQMLSCHPVDLSPPTQPDGRDSREAAKEYIEQAIKDGHCRFEWVHRRGQSEDFPVDIMLSSFVFRGRRMVHGTMRDLTAEKKAERERRDLEARLQLSSKLESVGSLAAGVAHEVNTPTQFISDNVRFLKDSFAQLGLILASHRELIARVEPLAECAEALAAVKAAETQNELDYLIEEIPRCLDQSLEGLRRISKIVGSLKEFSHPGGEAKSHADINRAIETTVSVSRHEWKYVADVVTELDSRIPKVNCVIDEINQALLNLIVNATHAIEDANKVKNIAKGLITIRTREEEGYVIIEVQDSGTGIPEGVRDRIFEPFYTTKPVGKGTGQGLAIVQAVVVKKHHGKVSFTTEIGQGTTFRLALPLTPQPAGATHQNWVAS